MIFVLAFTLIMAMFSQARSTMDNVLYQSDNRNFSQHVGATNANITRRVGIDSIIPTIYTYVTNPDASIRINIVESNATGSNPVTGGELLQVFDSSIEGIVENLAGNPTQLNELRDKKEGRIYERYNTPDTSLYMYNAPWVGSTYWTIDRINAYVYGYDTYVGNSKVKLRYGESGNNLFDLVETGEDSFLETYVEYQNSGRIYWNENHDESLVQVDGATKTIITYIHE